MKKKAIGIIWAAALLLMACGGEAKVISGEVQTKGGGEKAEVENEEEEEEGEEKEMKEAPSYKGYVFRSGDVVVEMDAEAKPILEQLGEANDYFETPSCAFDGIDKKYAYGSFELDTYPTGDKDFVSGVLFKDDSITTPEGIGIGDSREKMVNAYGGEGSEELGMTIYRKDNMKLCFILKEDSIVSIEYKSTVLDE